jgi:hypothetical protein
MITADGDVMGRMGIYQEASDSALRSTVEPRLRTLELMLEEGRSETVLADGLNEFITLLQEIVIVLATQVLHKPMGVRPATVRHAEDSTRGAGDTGFSEGTIDSLLGAVITFLGDHREIAYELQYTVILHAKRHVRDAGKLLMSVRIDGDDQRLMNRRNHGEYEALGGRAS